MTWLKRIFKGKEHQETAEEIMARRRRNEVIAQVVGAHMAWYPAHNEGRQPPDLAYATWTLVLQQSGLEDHELILLLADHKKRNELLGKTYSS